MSCKKKPRLGISIDNKILEEVNEYQYLGRLITTGNDMHADIDGRITAGWQRFGQYKEFLKDREMPTCPKRKIMNTVIFP